MSFISIQSTHKCVHPPLHAGTITTCPTLCQNEALRIQVRHLHQHAVRSGVLTIANDVSAKEGHQLNNGLVVLHCCALLHNKVHDLSCLRRLRTQTNNLNAQHRQAACMQARTSHLISDLCSACQERIPRAAWLC